MTEYRVVSNTINFRVQWLSKTLILRRLKWYWVKEYTYAGDFINEFDSVTEAYNAIVRLEKMDIAKKQGYKPVS